jgi:hypothetical protein
MLNITSDAMSLLSTDYVPGRAWGMGDREVWAITQLEGVHILGSGNHIASFKAERNEEQTPRTGKEGVTYSGPQRRLPGGSDLDICFKIGFIINI